MFSVSTIEARSVIRAIEKQNGSDLSGNSTASFRARLSEILVSHKLKNIDTLVGKIQDDPDYFELFMRDMSIGSPDMFRDPDLWIYLRDKLLPTILKSQRFPEIVIPQCVTGNELYSTSVLLTEMGIDYRVDLVATCLNKLLKDRILEGELPNIRYKNSKDNFEVFHPESSIENYTENQNGNICINPELLQGIDIRLIDKKQPAFSDKTSLVLYRNRMIYQNAEMQYRTLKKMLDEMKKETYFIIGIREAIDGFGLEHLYSEVSSDLKIYKKKDVD